MNPLGPSAPPPSLGPEGPGNTAGLADGPDSSSNPLAGKGGGPPAKPGSPGDSPHADMLVQMHKQAMAQYAQISKADELAQLVRKGIDKLVDKGDSVTDDDVVDEMATLVGQGADPAAMGALISGGGPSSSPPMPSGGPGLSQWLLAHDQQFAQMEQQIQGPLKAARLAVMTSAIHLLTHDHVLRKGASSNGRTNSGSQPGPSSAGSADDQPAGNGPFAGGPPGNA